VSQVLKRDNLMDLTDYVAGLLLHMKTECGFLAFISKKYETKSHYSLVVLFSYHWIE